MDCAAGSAGVGIAISSGSSLHQAPDVVVDAAGCRLSCCLGDVGHSAAGRTEVCRGWVGQSVAGWVNRLEYYDCTVCIPASGYRCSAMSASTMRYVRL